MAWHWREIQHNEQLIVPCHAHEAEHRVQSVVRFHPLEAAGLELKAMQ
jgi:hypothetical protein